MSHNWSTKLIEKIKNKSCWDYMYVAFFYATAGILKFLYVYYFYEDV